MRFYEYNIKKIKPNKLDSHGVILVTPESYRGTILVNDDEDPKLKAVKCMGETDDFIKEYYEVNVYPGNFYEKL